MCRTRGWGCGRIGGGLGREAKVLTQSSRREALSFAKDLGLSDGGVALSYWWWVF
jgi:hypothetical protein